MRGESRREHSRVHASGDGASEKAARLAPPEENAGSTARGGPDGEGVIFVEARDVEVSEDLTEKGGGKEGLFGFGWLALTILVFSLAFIIFIACLIAFESPVQPE